MLRGVAADVIPGCLRSDEDVHLDLNARIAVNCTESHSMYFAFVHPTDRGPASRTEIKTPSGRRLILSQILFPADPGEGTGCDLCVSRAGTAECLSTPRAVTTSTTAERRSDLERHSAV